MYLVDTAIIIAAEPLEAVVKRQVLCVCLCAAMLGACVSQPDPWTPDAQVDGKITGDSMRADGKGDIHPVDIGGTDVMDAGDTNADSKESIAVDIIELRDVTDVVESVDAQDIQNDTECIPQCDVAVCGDDGCEGSCGECGASETCHAGVCHSSVAIPDTGQTRCYDLAGEIKCPLEGAALFGQDGSYQGVPKSYVDNDDGTVTDQNTGLIWAKCSAGQNGSDCEGIAKKVEQVFGVHEN